MNMALSIPEPGKLNPLWIICASLVLTEYILANTIPNSTGIIQEALVAYVIFFSFSVLCGFFILLWHRPGNIYTPHDFNSDAAFLSAINRESGNIDFTALINNMMQTFENTLTSNQTITRISASNQKELPGVLKTYVETAAHEIKDSNFITVLLPSLGESSGINEVTYPISAIRDFDDLTNKVYFEMKKKPSVNNSLQPYKYGTTWLLQEKTTKKVFRHARMISGLGPGMRMDDDRPLEELGIRPGMVLEAVLLSNET